MTGPVHIEGAERGDALAVTIVEIEPAAFGHTVVVPGFGFLRDILPGPFIAKWELDRLSAVSDEIRGVRIPMCGFPGSIGVLPGPDEVAAALAREGALAAAGGFVSMPDPERAVPARLFGRGAGIRTGDIHFAQGDGEVCGSAIEMAARVTYRCELRKGAGRAIRFPHVEGDLQLRNGRPSRFHAVTGMPVKEAGYVPPHLAIPCPASCRYS